ncbi:hypothetical protein MN608_09524 [Microdochium nivale]|nr:hypothetical protein MN608_09524 [Microdochium nivale]
MPSVAHHTQTADTGFTSPWQDRLEDVCREYQIQSPIFQIVSDRRGGRTAWSSTVTVYGEQISARFWYDGKHLNNAKEDAAEAALNWMTKRSIISTPW